MTIRPTAKNNRAALGNLSSFGPQGFRWRLFGSPLPSVTHALRVGEATRAAVYRAADARGLLPLPDSFHRGSGGNHEHAFWLPEDADEDGLIDHVLLFTEAGLPQNLLPVLAAGGTLSLRDIGRWRLVPDWMGRRGASGLFGPAKFWVSASPYVTPWGRDGKRSGAPRPRSRPENQIQEELALRGLPAPTSCVLTNDPIRGLRPRSFARSTNNRKALKGAAAQRVEMLFTEPVWGPLAFGFGAHFGLGLFEPADERLS